jgi:hypothetical protein
VAHVARNIDAAPVPNPVLPVARELPPFTLLEIDFMRIGFTVHGACQLCSFEGENVTKEARTHLHG